MSYQKPLLIVFSLLVLHIAIHIYTADAQIYDLSAASAAMSAYPGGLGDFADADSFDLDLDNLEEGSTDEVKRRSLYWKRTYYISYGALSANRVPCPARSGRSYYTHDCFQARGTAHPYTRGCSCITRCRR